MVFGFTRKRLHQPRRIRDTWSGMKKTSPLTVLPVERITKTREETEMPVISSLDKIYGAIEKSARDRAAGLVDDAHIAKLHQSLALELYPQAKSVGVALNQFYATALGQQALKVATSLQSMALQKSCAVGDGDSHVEKHGDALTRVAKRCLRWFAQN